jgi:hypothetical protein
MDIHIRRDTQLCLKCSGKSLTSLREAFLFEADGTKHHNEGHLEQRFVQIEETG